MEKCRKLVIVRHGNTFRAGETPTRVGARTDLPLVEEERARSAGRYLREKGIVIDKVISAPLKRTLETANYILEEMNVDLPIIQDLRLKEIVMGRIEYGRRSCNKTFGISLFRKGGNGAERPNRRSDRGEGTFRDRPME